MLFWVAVSLLCAALCWWLAARQGRRGVGWLVVGLLLGPLGVIAQLLIFKVKEGGNQSDINRMAAMKSSIALGETQRVAKLLMGRNWNADELEYLNELADLNGQPEIKRLIEQNLASDR